MRTSVHLRRFIRVLLSGTLVGSLLLMAGVPAANAGISDKYNDFNDDRISDIVAVNTDDGCLWRWQGTGTGSHGPRQRIGCGWTPYRGNVLAPGDINSDGHGDLVALNPVTGCLYRWLGNGNWTFGAGTLVECGIHATFNFRMVGAGDLNNDQDGDLVAMSAGGCLSRWLGDGAGGFGPSAVVNCNMGAYESSIAAPGDIDGDGYADLVGINTTNGCLYRFLNDGSGLGTVGAAEQISCGWGTYQWTPMAGLGDFNRDGPGDLVGINGSTTCLYRWHGNGSGGFGAGANLGCGWNDEVFVR